MNKVTFTILAIVGMVVIAFSYSSNYYRNKELNSQQEQTEQPEQNNNLQVGSPNNVLEVDREENEFEETTPNRNMDNNNEGLTLEQKLNMPEPETIIDTKKDYKVVITTSEGEITVDLNEKEVPNTVNNFVYLANEGFYDNVIFHRIIEGFMIQTGDPVGNGTGGPGYKFNDEDFEGEYTRGTLAMANSGPNTNGSQFFIMHQDNDLPPNYVIFGSVTEGMDIVDKIASMEVTTSQSGENSKPVNPPKITTVEIVSE